MESVGLEEREKVYGLGLRVSNLKDCTSGSQKSMDAAQPNSVPMVDTKVQGRCCQSDFEIGGGTKGK